MVRSFALAGAVAAATMLPATASTPSGEFSGTFAEPTGQTSSTFVHEGAGTDTLTWGTPDGPSQTVEDGNAAVLSVDATNFSFANAGAGDFLLGSITWTNQSNWHTGGTWSSVMTLNLTLDTAAGQTTQSVPVSFTVYNSTDTTANTDFNETTGDTADEISGMVLDGSAFNVPIDLGHGLSLTEVLFRLDDAGTPGTNWTAATGFTHEGAASGSQYDATTGLWENREGGTSVIGVYGTVSAQALPASGVPAVPLPAGLWLLLSGLGGAFLFGRRQTGKA
jgi:hypothetical protein